MYTKRLSVSSLDGRECSTVRDCVVIEPQRTCRHGRTARVRLAVAVGDEQTRAVLHKRNGAPDGDERVLEGDALRHVKDKPSARLRGVRDGERLLRNTLWSSQLERVTLEVNRLAREQVVVHAEAAPVAVCRQHRRRLKRHALVRRELRDGRGIRQVEVEHAEENAAAVSGNGACRQLPHHVRAHPVRGVVEVAALARAHPVRSRHDVRVRHVVIDAVRLQTRRLGIGDGGSRDAESSVLRHRAPGKDALAVREAARTDVKRHHGARSKLDCAGGAGRGPRSRLGGEVDDGPVLHRDGIEAVSNRREGAEHLEIGRARVGGARVARHVVRDGHRLRHVDRTRDVVRRVIRGRDRLDMGLEHAVAFKLDRAVGGRPGAAVPYLVRGNCCGERVTIQGERTGDVRGTRYVDEGVRPEHNRAVRAPFGIPRRTRVRERAAVHVHAVSMEIVYAFVVERAAGLNRYGGSIRAEHGPVTLRVVCLVRSALTVVVYVHQSFVNRRATGLLVKSQACRAVRSPDMVRALTILDDMYGT